MAKLLVCVCVMLLLVSLSESSPSVPCCTTYQKNPVAFKRLKAFVIQEITGFCNIRAVIFKTLKNTFFCADPEKKWVQRAMRHLSWNQR